MHEIIRCPICGMAMMISPSSAKEEGYENYHCDSCNVTADITYEAPEDLSVEFSKGNYGMMAHVFRNDPTKGFYISFWLGETLGLDDVIIYSEFCDGPDMDTLSDAAARFFKDFLPFAERYSPKAVEEALEEYREQLKK